MSCLFVRPEIAPSRGGLAVVNSPTIPGRLWGLMWSRVPVAAVGGGWAGPSNSHSSRLGPPQTVERADGLAGGGQISVSGWLPGRARTLPSPHRTCPHRPALSRASAGPCAPGPPCTVSASYFRDPKPKGPRHARLPHLSSWESLLPRVHGGAELILAFPGWELGGAQDGSRARGD